MTEKDPKRIEKPVRLSESKLWEIQRNYFSSMGIEAWKNEVPFYISSNAFIGQRYAALVSAFIQDCIALNPALKNEPFYILELGSGTGKFSFYFLKAFNALLESENRINQKFCYIISDMVLENVTFCQNNASFKPYLEQNQLDFCQFDVEKTKDFQLLNLQKNYSALHAKTPLIVIGNYTFDCITQDSFEFEGGSHKEVKVGLTSRYKNYDVKKGLHLNDLHLQFDYEKIKIDHYYDNPILNDILKEYGKAYPQENIMLMMPLGAISFLDNINALTQKNYFLISGDKGVSRSEKFHLFTENNRCTYDGCYSFLVNFDAMGRYLKHLSGDCLLTQKSNNFSVNLFSMGNHFSNLPKTKTYFETTIEAFGPEEYCYIFDECVSCGYRFSLRSVLSFIRLSEWDPEAYAIVHDRLQELAVPSAQEERDIDDLFKTIDKVVKNIYELKLGKDYYNFLGMFYQKLNQYDKALNLYQKAIQVHGDAAPPHNNMAMIYEEQKHYDKALFHYEKSFALDKKNIFARRRIYRLSGKPYMAMISPIIKSIILIGTISGALYLLTR